MESAAGPSSRPEEPMEDASARKGRKRVRHVDAWKKTKRKRRRNCGQEYSSASNKTVSTAGMINSYIHPRACLNL